ncbi:tumor necrosis factor receptor superfamily member 6 isoform X2 [Anolis carolinensis]|uniref:tumor necrosis factor receptor superfamily member 6 isoform X2 n=1 Tax=Anolis carolinensis TaxID=28377 RepID=UPI002F2B327B
MTGKLLLYLLTLCPACSLISGPSLDNDSHRPYKKRFAVKRISKRDGIICQLNMQYQFNTTTGVICCSSCNPGSVAINIGCTKTYPITKCKNCIEGKEYMDKFNHKTKCLRCNDCDKEHGLEVETNCTAKQNVKCKCRPGFFCNSPPCQHCDPCDTCEEGTVLEKCTETQNTKCQRREHVPWYKWALPILFVILVAVPVIFIICKRMRNNRRTYRIPPGDKNNETEPMYPGRCKIRSYIKWTFNSAFGNRVVILEFTKSFCMDEKWCFSCYWTPPPINLAQLMVQQHLKIQILFPCTNYCIENPTAPPIIKHNED